MGIMYLGPVDGHNISQMVKAFREATRLQGPVLVHVLTKKGKGYRPAERHPARFHGTDPFNIKTGLPLKKRVKANYTDVFSTVMCKLGERDPSVVAVTAAMSDGTGLKRLLQGLRLQGLNLLWRFIRHFCSGRTIRCCMMSVSRTFRWYLLLTGRGL